MDKLVSEIYITKEFPDYDSVTRKMLIDMGANVAEKIGIGRRCVVHFVKDIQEHDGGRLIRLTCRVSDVETDVYKFEMPECKKVSRLTRLKQFILGR